MASATGSEASENLEVVEIPSPYNITLRLERGLPRPKSALHILEHLGTLSVSGSALDLGTGYTGILALALASRGAKRVVGLDINPEAIASAAHCSDISGSIDWRVSDMFSALEPGTVFDTIVSNPPQLPMSHQGRPHDYGGTTGREIIFHILKNAPLFLKAGGKLILGIMDYLGVDKRYNECPSLLEIAERTGLHGQVALSRPVIVRKGGATEESLEYIQRLYPDYDFLAAAADRPSYQYQVVEFRKL